MHHPHFSARVITGAGRGKTLGTPTLNVHLADVPSALKEGIYAGRVEADGRWYKAAIHYGPRPVFKDDRSFEAHLLDASLDRSPERIGVDVVAFLRPVEDFPSSDALMKQIADDIAQARAILDAHGSSNA